MELYEYVRVLRQRWRIVAATTILGLIVAGIVTAVMPTSYEATTETFVSVSSVTQNDPTASFQQATQFTLQRIKSYAQLADSGDVLQPVIDQLGLHESVADLAGHVTVTNPTDTVLLLVSVDDANAAQAARVADAVAEQLATAIERLEPPLRGQPLITVTVTKHAAVPTAPVSPRRTLNLVLGLIAGVAIGLLVAILRHQFDRSVRSVEEAQDAAGGARVLGGITLPVRSGGGRPVKLTAHQHRQFEALGHALDRAASHNHPGLLLVTSPLGGESRGVTVVGIARTLAERGRRVCIVDADWRQPRLGALLGVDGSLGLSDVLLGQASLDEAMSRIGDTSLQALLAGRPVEDPAQLAGSEAMRTTLSALRGRFDHVVLIAAPVLPVPDAGLLAQSVDQVLLVARYRRTARRALSEAVNALAPGSDSQIGVVLTGTPRKLIRIVRYGTAVPVRDPRAARQPVPADVLTGPRSTPQHAANPAPAKETVR